MIINTDYILNADLINRNKSNKNKIVIGNIAEYNFEEYLKSLTSNIFDFHIKQPHYIVDIDGKVYQIVPYEYYTDYVDTPYSDTILSIGIINMGRITCLENGNFDVYNNHYHGSIFESEWKGVKYWANYTESQMNAISELAKYLCWDYGIAKKIKQTNVKVGDINGWNGIAFRSNFNPKYYDVSPAFNILEFTEKFQ